MLRRRLILDTVSPLNKFIGQVRSLGATTNDDGLTIYNNLAAALRDSAALSLFPYAYAGNTVYGMDKNGNPVAFAHSRGTNATYFDKTGKLQLATGPRFDYNPATLAYNGLMLERAASTNLVLKSDTTNSETLSNNVSFAPMAWPMGMLANAVVYGDNSLTRVHYAGTVAINTPYVFSVFIKMDDNSTPVVGTSSTNGDVAINIAGNTCTTVGVIPIGSNVYRIYGTFTTGGSVNASTGIAKYNTQSAKGFKVSGIQLEVGTYPSAYIPTFGATATRAADALQSNGDVIPYSEASVFIWQAARKTGIGGPYYVHRTDSSGRIWYDGSADATTVGYQAYDGANVVISAAIPNNAGVFEKGCTTYGTAGLKVCRNAGTVASSSFDGSMGAAGNLLIDADAVSLYYLKALVVVPRQLSTTEMQQVTT